MKWADDWGPEEQNKPRSLIADGILEEVHPLTSGSTRGAHRQSSPEAALGPEFVDREIQEAEFRDFFDLAKWSRPGAAQIYLLPAMEIDCPGYFVERLRQGTVQRLANALKGSDRAGIPSPVKVPEPRYQPLESAD